MVATSSGNVKCKKCGQNLHRPLGAASEPCTQCGDPEWDEEFDLAPRVGRTVAYYVIGEAQDGNRIVTLDLLGVRQFETRTSVQLCHRLKDSWRKFKQDNSAKSGAELIVSFELPEHGPNAGLWMFHRVKRQLDPAARKCRRHSWALQAGARDYDLFAAAHLYPCSCATNCAMCNTAREFSLARIKLGAGVDITTLVKLRDTVTDEIAEEAYLP
jgi:hypothetical protein